MFKIYILLLKQNNTNIGLKMCKATAFSRTSPTLKCPQEGRGLSTSTVLRSAVSAESESGSGQYCCDVGEALGQWQNLLKWFVPCSVTETCPHCHEKQSWSKMVPLHGYRGNASRQTPQLKWKCEWVHHVTPCSSSAHDCFLFTLGYFILAFCFAVWLGPVLALFFGLSGGDFEAPGPAARALVFHRAVLGQGGTGVCSLEAALP